MELRQLAYVVAVARHKNFTRAAEELCIAQPALSAQISKFEAELQLRLFERTSRRVTVTPAGDAFVLRARRILSDVDALASEMAEHAGAARGRVRIGGWYIINPELPDLLAGFAQQHPWIDLTVREETSDLMLQMLRAGELDVALPVLRDGLDFAEIDHLIYRREPFVLVTAVGSPLESRKAIRIGELDGTPMIVFKPGSSIAYLVDRAFAAVGLAPRIALETAQLSTVRAFVSKGLGVAIIPRSVAEADGPPVAIVDVTPTPIRISALAWRRAGQTSATEAFVAYVRTRLGMDVENVSRQTPLTAYPADLVSPRSSS